MISVFVLFSLFGVVFVQGSASNSINEGRTIIYRANFLLDNIGHIKYEDGEIFIYQNQKKPTHFFFTPFPVVNPWNSECHNNMLTGHTEFTLVVELYTPKLVQAVHAYLHQQFPIIFNPNNTVSLSLLPVDTIRLVQNGHRKKSSQEVYTIGDKCYYNTLFRRSVKFPIYTVNETVCEHLKSSVIQNCRMLNLRAHYTLHSEVTIERQFEITTRQIMNTSMFSQIESQFPKYQVVALTNGDFKRLISEITDTIIMKLKIQEGFNCEPQDPIVIENLLTKELRLKQVSDAMNFLK